MGGWAFPNLGVERVLPLKQEIISALLPDTNGEWRQFMFSERATNFLLSAENVQPESLRKRHVEAVETLNHLVGSVQLRGQFNILCYLSFPVRQFICLSKALRWIKHVMYILSSDWTVIFSCFHYTGSFTQRCVSTFILSTFMQLSGVQINSASVSRGNQTKSD